jgi:hypothetical protein
MATKQSVRGGWSGVATGVRRSRVPQTLNVNITNVHSWFANFVYYLLYAITKKLFDVTSITEIFYNNKASMASSFRASKFFIFLPFDFSHKVEIVYHDALKSDVVVNSPLDCDYGNMHIAFVALNFKFINLSSSMFNIHFYTL